MKKTLALGALLFCITVPTGFVLAHTTNADKTPPKITYLHVGSSGNPASTKAGDKVTISLTADEKVNPIVLVETRTLFAKSTNTSGNSWDESYTVDPRDPQGKIDYIITLTDTSGNIYICTSLKLPIQIVPRCLTTDGSSVTIVKNTPPADTQAPVIAGHADVFVVGTNTGAVVTYTNPTATDNVDTAVTVSCAPASGSNFALGSTTTACTTHDAAGNNATPTTFTVKVTLPPPDTQAPVIAPHADISVVGTHAGAVVTYTNPSATDNVDATVTVSCIPASGSNFAYASTTVTCTAHDVAGNNATPTIFTVGVSAPPPTPFTLSTQADESFLCPSDWENCFTGGAAQTAINLGQGSSLGSGTLLSATIAKDEHSPFVNQPWILQIECYTDNTYSIPCPDWVQPNSWNANHTNIVSELSTTTTDGKHWTAYFTTANESNFGSGTSPVVMNPNYFYRLIINDGGWNIGAYGQQTPAIPYYQVTGMTF